jgi:hypothetical protein
MAKRTLEEFLLGENGVDRHIHERAYERALEVIREEGGPVS